MSMRDGQFMSVPNMAEQPREVDVVATIKAIGDMLAAEIQENKRLEARVQELEFFLPHLRAVVEQEWAENQRLRKLLTLFLEASAACDTSICGLAIDRIKDVLKEATP